MSNNRPRAVDSKRRRDDALNVADFKIDDILNVPGDQLLAEVDEDFGDPGFLAAQFDSIALPAVSSHDRSGANRGGAVATFRVRPAAPGAASARALPRPPRWSFCRVAFAIRAEWPVVLLRHRIVLGACATLLLVAALTPGIYPLLVNRSADRITAIPQDDRQDEPLTANPAPVWPAAQSPAAPVTASGGRPREAPVTAFARRSPAVQETPYASQQPPSAEPKQVGTVTGGNDQAAGLVPDLASRLSASIAPALRAPPPPIAAAPPAIAGTLRAAAPRVPEGGGFFVQLSAPKSEAEALSTLQALRSKYAVLKGYEPAIRRKDEGKRGVTYAVQVGPFESPDDADQLCQQLKTAGGVCFITRN